VFGLPAADSGRPAHQRDAAPFGVDVDHQVGPRVAWLVGAIAVRGEGKVVPHVTAVDLDAQIHVLAVVPGARRQKQRHPLREPVLGIRVERLLGPRPAEGARRGVGGLRNTIALSGRQRLIADLRQKHLRVDLVIGRLLLGQPGCRAIGDETGGIHDSFPQHAQQRQKVELTRVAHQHPGGVAVELPRHDHVAPVISLHRFDGPHVHQPVALTFEQPLAAQVLLHFGDRVDTCAQLQETLVISTVFRVIGQASDAAQLEPVRGALQSGDERRDGGSVSALLVEGAPRVDAPVL